jgi:hypothetical protein
VLTLLAAGFLALDAVLLVLAAVWSSRPILAVWGAMLGVGAAWVVVLRRRYLVRLDELAQARESLKRELGDLARAVPRAPR